MTHLVSFVFCTIRIRIWRAYTNNNIYPFSFSRRTRKGVKTKSGSTSSASSSSSSSSREDIAFPFSTGSSSAKLNLLAAFCGGFYSVSSMKTLPGHESSSQYIKRPPQHFLPPLILRTQHPQKEPLTTTITTTPNSLRVHISPGQTRHFLLQKQITCNFTSHTQSHILWNRIPSVEFTELISILNGFKIS